MDERERIIESLKKDLESKEKDIYLAATLGKQLLQEKEELRRKQEELLSLIEALKQEKHSLQLSVDAKEKVTLVQAAENESLKESFESVSLSYEQLKKDDMLLAKNYQELKKENSDIKKAHEDLVSTCSELREQVSSLQLQVNDYLDQMNQSLNETLYSEEHQKLQNELNSALKEKESLELVLHEIQSELEQMKNKETKFIQKIEMLQEEITDKDKEISTYSVLIEKAKEEATELRGEIEMLKLEQLDVNRRGNSVFGELDDRRIAVENKYIELRDRYRDIESQFMENLVSLRRTKNQLAAALASMSLRNVDAEHIEKLENHLHSSKREIKELTYRLIDAEKKNQQAAVSPDPKAMVLQKDTTDYLRLTLQHSEKKIKRLEDELTLVRKQKVLDNGKLIEAENKLYFAEKDAVMYRSQALKLTLKVEELQCKDKENIKRAPKEEMIPGFVKQSEKGQKECHETETSKVSQVLSSTSAKLNGSIPQKDGVHSTQSSYRTVLCSEGKVRRSLPKTKSKKEITANEDDLNDSTCIQQ